MRKNKHAVALGRNGGKATARKRTKDERSASARHAAIKRWEKRLMPGIEFSLAVMRSDEHQESCQVAEKGKNKYK